MHESGSNDLVENFYHRLLTALDQGGDLSRITSLLVETESFTVDDATRSRMVESAKHAVSLCKRLEEYQQKERALRSVFEIAQTLTALDNLDDVLFNIVAQGRKLLGSDVAWLAKEAGPIVNVLAVDGANTAGLSSMVGRPDIGIAGYVASNVAPFTTYDYLTDNRIVHDAGIDRVLESESIKSVIGVPIVTDHRVIGVLIIGDRYQRTYLSWEISTLSTLAAHAGVAIQNAQNYEAKTTALNAEKTANVKLEERVNELEQSTQAHETLSGKLAQGVSFRELITVIADILHGYVAFLDPSGLILASSRSEASEVESASAGEFEHNVDVEKLYAESEESRRSGRSVEVKRETGELHERVIAVSSGEDYIGYLVVRTRKQMADNEIRIFERCSSVLAVIKLLEERRYASTKEDINLTVRALFEDNKNDRTGVFDRAYSYGLDCNQEVLVGLISVERSKISHVVNMLSERLRTRHKIITEIGGQVILLCNSSEQEAIRKRIETIVFRDCKCQGVASLSYPILNKDELPAYFRRLRQSLALLRKLGRYNAVAFEPELSMYSSLFQHSNGGQIDNLIAAKIGKLKAYDGAKGTQLVRTLLLFLENKRNARATAERLGVHVNTVHNRLETVRDLLPSWDQNDQALEIHIALKLDALRSVDDFPTAI